VDSEIERNLIEVSFVNLAQKNMHN